MNHRPFFFASVPDSSPGVGALSSRDDPVRGRLGLILHKGMAAFKNATIAPG
jgi:hypothetical protein